MTIDGYLNKSKQINVDNRKNQEINNSCANKVTEKKSVYSDPYRENAIQKKINERMVADSMGNVDVSNKYTYRRKKNTKNNCKQKAVEELSNRLAQFLANI